MISESIVIISNGDTFLLRKENEFIFLKGDVLSFPKISYYIEEDFNVIVQEADFKVKT